MGHPLVPAYTGPFQVLERRPKTFKILHDSKEDWVTVDRLKAYWAGQGQRGHARIFLRCVAIVRAHLGGPYYVRENPWDFCKKSVK